MGRDPVAGDASHGTGQHDSGLLRRLEVGHRAGLGAEYLVLMDMNHLDRGTDRLLLFTAPGGVPPWGAGTTIDLPRLTMRLSSTRRWAGVSLIEGGESRGKSASCDACRQNRAPPTRTS